MRPAGHILLCLLALALLAGAVPAHATKLPAGWPGTVEIGMRDEEHGAAQLRAETRMGIRYHYLSGGVRTGRGWQTWARGGGSFVSGFIEQSQANGFLPAFSYYMLWESAPGNSQNEADGIQRNLGDRETMRALLEDLRVFFQKAGETKVTTVLHVEPDAWGYMQQRNGDDAARQTAIVGSSGIAELEGLPDTAAGLAQAIQRMRDRHAPNVLLGFHLSDWGTGVNISDADPSEARIDELADRSARFVRSLGARFDLVFGEFANRDAAYSELVDGREDAWWDEGDFARHKRYLAGVASELSLPIVLWQIPVGNRVMRALDNTPGHWQDNRVEWLLGEGGRDRMADYVRAGVVAFLFGHAHPNDTCACDQMSDGITNPAPINGNVLRSLSADDDGGYLKQQTNLYYGRGSLAVPGGSVRRPAHARRRTKAPRLRIHATARTRSVRRGRTARVDVRVTSASTARGLVAVQLFAPNGRRHSYQMPFRGQRFRARIPRRYVVRFTLPRTARRGQWRVKVGVFDPDWRRLYAWSERATAFRVR